jgi:hypothetical protein
MSAWFMQPLKADRLMVLTFFQACVQADTATRRQPCPEREVAELQLKAQCAPTLDGVYTVERLNHRQHANINQGAFKLHVQRILGVEILRQTACHHAMLSQAALTETRHHLDRYKHWTDIGNRHSPRNLLS